MRFISWNVNGLRACFNKDFLTFFNTIGADIFCIQETKMQKYQSNFVFPNYYEYWNSALKKGYSGTLVLSKVEPINVTYGICKEEHDNEGRVITLEYDKFYLINVYTPNSQRELTRLDYRMIWDIAFREYVCSFSKPVIICGDLNVAHKDIDLKNPKQNVRNAGFTKEERDKFSALLDYGFIDSFRYLYPDKTDAYTWWSYMANSRAKNTGWRIDYFLLSESIAQNLIDSYIYADVYGSDHCPVGISLDI